MPNPESSHLPLDAGQHKSGTREKLKREQEKKERREEKNQKRKQKNQQPKTS